MEDLESLLPPQTTGQQQELIVLQERSFYHKKKKAAKTKKIATKKPNKCLSYLEEYFIKKVDQDEIVSLLSGFMFGAGWWMFISAYIHGRYNIFEDPELPGVWMGQPLWWFFIPGILSSIGYGMLNLIRFQAAWGHSNSEWDDASLTCGRNWIFGSFVMLASGLLAGWWIMFSRFIVGGRLDGPIPENKAQGVTLALQTTLIFLSALLMRFGRKMHDNDEDEEQDI